MKNTLLAVSIALNVLLGVLVVRGEVELQYLLPSGEARTIDMIPAGELVGWTALVDPHRRFEDPPPGNGYVPRFPRPAGLRAAQL